MHAPGLRAPQPPFMQDLREAASLTHVVVGEGGIAALPLQLQPGRARLAGSSPGQSDLPVTAAAPPAVGTTPGAAGGRGAASPAAAAAAHDKIYVSHGWVEQSLAKGSLLPPADFPPPDAAAQVATPVAGSGELDHKADLRHIAMLICGSVRMQAWGRCLDADA